MGNRAVLAFADSEGEIASFGVYLHWNGGIESVAAFLDYAEEVHHRAGDCSYSASRLTQVIGNYFGGSLSLGLVEVDKKNPGASDPGDNGVFIVDCSGKLKGRERLIGHYSENYPSRKIVKATKAAMKKRLAAMDMAYYENVLTGIREANAAVKHAEEAM